VQFCLEQDFLINISISISSISILLEGLILNFPLLLFYLLLPKRAKEEEEREIVFPSFRFLSPATPAAPFSEKSNWHIPYSHTLPDSCPLSLGRQAGMDMEECVEGCAESMLVLRTHFLFTLSFKVEGKDLPGEGQTE